MEETKVKKVIRQVVVKEEIHSLLVAKSKELKKSIKALVHEAIIAKYQTTEGN